MSGWWIILSDVGIELTPEASALVISWALIILAVIVMAIPRKGGRK